MLFNKCYNMNSEGEAMNKKVIVIILIICIGIVLIIRSLGSSTGDTIYIQAAASMQNALSEIEIEFEAQGYDLEINYGGSGTLVTQIQEGAPADIFISASMANFDKLKATNELVDESVLLNNELVLIKNKNSDVTDLEQAKKIAIGTPDAVPAGTYATQTIEKLGLTEKLNDKLVQTKDVSEVLTYVETGDADLGFVYNTDALASSDVDIVESYDDSYHDPIEYPIGLLTNSKSAKDFYDYLHSKQGIEVFEKYGFISHE